MKAYLTLFKKELLLILPMALAFVFFSAMIQNSIIVSIDSQFAEFTEYPLNGAGVNGLIAEHLTVSPWLILLTVLLALIQYAGFDNLFAATWPVKRAGIIVIKFICAVITFIPALGVCAVSMIAIRAHNLDFIMNSIAAYPAELHMVMADSASMSVILWQTGLCFVSLTAIYVLSVLIITAVRYKTIATAITACALFYFQLLFEFISSILYNAGIADGFAALGYLGLFDFANLSYGAMKPLTAKSYNRVIEAASGDFLSNILPAVHIYRFDLAAIKLVIASVITVTLFYFCLKAYSSERQLTGRGVFLFPAAQRLFITAAVVWATAFTVYAVQENAGLQRYRLDDLAISEERIADTELIPFKQAFAEELIERYHMSYSRSPNLLSFVTRDRAAFDKIAAAIDGLGMSGFEGFIAECKNTGSFAYSGHDMLIIYSHDDEGYLRLSIYMNNLNYAPDSPNVPGYFLSDAQIGGEYDVYEYMNESFIMAVLRNGGAREPCPVKAAVHVKDGIRRIEMILAFPPGQEPFADESVIDSFAKAAGLNDYTYTSQTRYMLRRYYEWNFVEVNVIPIS